MGAPQGLRSEAHSLKRAGLQILDEDIRLQQERSQLILARRRTEIDNKRLFATIEPDEITALTSHDVIIAAGKVPFRPFDLDDAGAGVGKARRAERGCDGRLAGGERQAREG